MNMFDSDDPLFQVMPGSDLLFSPTALTAPLPPTTSLPSTDDNNNNNNNHLPPHQQQNIRKRQRTSPAPSFRRDSNGPESLHSSTHSHSSTHTSSTHIPSSELAQKLRSENPDDTVEALNYLLTKSVNHDMNFFLGLNGHRVIDALVQLFDEIIGWKHGNDKWVIQPDRADEDDADVDADEDDLVPSPKTWECHASPSNSAAGEGSMDELDWQSFCAAKFAPAMMNTACTPSHVPPRNLQNDENDKEGMKMLEIIMMIVRNLSYVQENVRYILHSFGMMRIITGSLYFRNFYTGKEMRGPKSERDESALALGNSSNNICLHAMNATFNMASFLDITGKKMFLDLYFFDGEQDPVQNQTKGARSNETVDVNEYINTDNYGKIKNMAWSALLIAKNFNTKDETLSKLPDGIFRPAVRNYVRTMMTVFPPLFSLLRVRTSRSVVISTLETIILLVDNPDNHEVFVHTPDALLGQLVYLLWIPRLGPDSIEYMDPIINSVSRVSAMKLLGGYDIAVDYEVRDRSVEILYKLTSMNDDLKRRVGRRIVITQTDSYDVNVATVTNQPNTRLYDAIVPALTTKVGRDLTAQYAAKFLANLAEVEENRPGILYIEKKILRATTVVNQEIGSILFNGVLDKVV